MSVPRIASMMTFLLCFFCCLLNSKNTSFSGYVMSLAAVEAWWRSRTASSLWVVARMSPVSMR